MDESGENLFAGSRRAANEHRYFSARYTRAEGQQLLRERVTKYHAVLGRNGCCGDGELGVRVFGSCGHRRTIGRNRTVLSNLRAR